MRAYVSYLDPETLSWEEILNSNGVVTGVHRRIYNKDPESGDFTSFAEIPKGWIGPSGAHYHSTFEEAFILSGSLTLDGEDYLESGSYLYRPGMVVHGWTELSEGAHIIIRRGGPADIIPVEKLHSYEYPYEEVHDGRPHILHLRTDELEWTWHGADKDRYGIKVLSQDKDSGARTLLLHLPPGWNGSYSGPNERAVECVVVSGEMSLADGTVFGQSCYFCRPPGVDDDPIAHSKQGSTLLMWEE